MDCQKTDRDWRFETRGSDRGTITVAVEEVLRYLPEGLPTKYTSILNWIRYSEFKKGTVIVFRCFKVDERVKISIEFLSEECYAEGGLGAKNAYINFGEYDIFHNERSNEKISISVRLIDDDGKATLTTFETKFEEVLDSYRDMIESTLSHFVVEPVFEEPLFDPNLPKIDMAVYLDITDWYDAPCAGYIMTGPRDDSREMYFYALENMNDKHDRRFLVYRISTIRQIHALLRTVSPKYKKAADWVFHRVVARIFGYVRAVRLFVYPSKKDVVGYAVM